MTTLPPLPDGPGSWLLVGDAWELQAVTQPPMMPGQRGRARDDSGRFIADDPATPDVDEAWQSASSD